jgi:microcystin-dependent protein
MGPNDAFWCLANGSDILHETILISKFKNQDVLGFQYRDSTGTTTETGTLLDSYHGVANASLQAGSVTIDKLAQSLVNIIIPPGMIRFFAGPSPPATWLVCDGSEVSRTTYAALFAAIGTYWGAGNNISTFNLPDFRGRSPLGYVNNAVAGITPRAFASLGGEEYHVLSQAELAAHNHAVFSNTTGVSITQTPHSHGIVNPVGGAAAAVGSGQYSAVGSTQTLTANANVSISDPGHAHGVSNTGGNGGHNNMSPFAVLYVIIKT